MAKIPPYEHALIERLFQMSDGYVMDFSNGRFSDFIAASVNINIYDPKYSEGNSGSKANILRRFFQIEPNHVVGRLLGDFIERYRALAESANRFEVDSYNAIKQLSSQLQQFPIELKETLIPVAEFLEDKEFYVVILNDIKDAINRNQPEACVDRMHTFIVKLLRQLCNKHELNYDAGQTLVKSFKTYTGHLEKSISGLSEMSIQIMKGACNVLHHYDNVRNTRSLAHANTLLSKAESVYILKSVANIIEFIQAMELMMPVFVTGDDLPF